MTGVDSSGMTVQVAAELDPGASAWLISTWYEYPPPDEECPNEFCGGPNLATNVPAGDSLKITEQIVSVAGGGHEWVGNVTNLTTHKLYGQNIIPTSSSNLANEAQEVYAFESYTNTTKYFQGTTVTSNPTVEYFSEGTWTTSFFGPSYVVTSNASCEGRFGVNGWVGWSGTGVPSWWVEEGTSQVSTLPYGEVTQGYQLSSGVNSCSQSSSPTLWDNPPAITVDSGISGNIQSGTSKTVVLPRIKQGDMVLVFVAAAGNGNTLNCSSPDLGYLSNRTTDKGNFDAKAQTAELYAISSGAYNNESITCTDTAPNNFSILAVSLTPPLGTTIGFDPNNPYPNKDDPFFPGKSDSLTISTKGSTDMVIGMFLAKGSGQTFTEGNGYSWAESSTSGGPSALMEEKTVFSPQTNLPVYANWTSSNYYMTIADAVSATNSSGPFEIDHAANNRCSGTGSCSAPLSTNYPDDVIIALCTDGGSGTGQPTVSGGGITDWTPESSPGSLSSTPWIAMWYGTSSSKLNGASITCTAGTTANVDIQVFGISGADTLSPFDSHSGLPQVQPTSATDSNSPSLTVSTSNANDMILGFLSASSNPGTIQAGNGFTLVESPWNSPVAAVEYKIVSSTQSSLPVGFSLQSPEYWQMIGDAVQA